MGLIQAITGRKLIQFISKDDSGESTIFEIEVTQKIKPSRKSTPTKFQVEAGNTISDHIVLDPFSLEIEGIISDSPLSIKNALITSGAAAAGNAIGKTLGTVAGVAGVSLVTTLLKSKNRSEVAYGQLVSLQERKQPFDVLTGFTLYKDMWITNLSFPRDEKTGDALIFNVTLEQLLLVQPKTVRLQVLANGDVGAEKVEHGEEDSEALRRFKKGDANATSLFKSDGLTPGG